MSLALRGIRPTHNVKILAQGREGEPQGPVRSEEQKNAIEEKAIEIGNVVDQLEVAPPRS